MKKKIVIIDDSALMRRVISDIINKDERLEVVATACDGLSGMDLLIKNNGSYDVVLLDVNMPRMNGLELLTNIQKYKMKCKVIMVSTLVLDGAKETILALERGAFDFVLKPSSTDNHKMDEFGKKLIRSIEMALHLERKTDEDKTIHQENTIKSEHKPLRTGNTSNALNKLVVIASSTGGPKSLKSIITNIPPNIDAPVLVVQHMPEGFTKSLAIRMDELSDINVDEATEHQKLEKGKVYIAPGGNHIRVVSEGKSSYIKLSKEKPIQGLRPCANVLFESVKDTEFDYIVCVVITGMGSDGTKGISKLCESKNVHVIAQDEKTSIVYGMPRAIATAGLADEIVPLDKIAGSIIKNVGVLNNGR